ncbi:MAG: 2-hydroxyglutaryl-CoA dehydratase [Alphaproteobacteria bacterium]|nr:MAG: 2-hydroxyglutaryl-CoA dehydratase [Alphaproteobacteria bacterium]
MTNAMKDYFLDLDAASKDPARKVAWCTSVGPAEILRAMGFEVFFPENHGAMLGATRVCMDTIPVANANGYSPEICSYLTSDVGAYMKGITPLTKAFGIEKVPHPDVLVYNTNQCKDVMHWFEYYATEFDCPIFGIHPPTNVPDIKQEYIDDVAQQFEELITFLEPVTGAPMNPERLEETVALSLKATNLWSEVLDTAQATPSPMTFFDATIYMGPIVVLRGTQVAVDYYQNLLAELKQKVAKNYAAVEKEGKRIYWDGMPVWGRLRALSNTFNENHACVVASTYCNSWIFSDFDPGDPLPSMARAYIKIFINRNDKYKEDYIETMVRDFKIDGVIFLAARTCPNNSNAYYNLPKKLREKGIPTIIIDGDLCDLRCYSDEGATTLIEAFLETI